MKKVILCLSILSVVPAMPRLSRADFALSLSSSADVNHLHVGDSVTFDVTLSGVNSGDPNTYLSYLAATIGYNSSLLSPNPSVSPGAIVPGPSGFVGTSLSDAADAYYDGVFIASTPISQDGTFFSFQVTALQAGSGTLSFTAAAATLASDPNQNNQFTPQTSDLNFTIEAGSPGIVTPEPRSWVLAVSGLACLALFALRWACGRSTAKAPSSA